MELLVQAETITQIVKDDDWVPMDHHSHTDFLIAGLRGDRPPKLSACPETLPGAAVYHGMTAKVVGSPQAMDALPPGVREALRSQAVKETMWDLRHRAILKGILSDLADAEVKTVLLKGTALAYTFYENPADRPRGDTDLLVAEDQLPQLRNVLERHGFRRTVEASAEKTPQEEWFLESETFGVHYLDVHWRLLSSWALSSLFDTDLILATAVKVPKLGKGAWRPSTEILLLHACVHRAQHYSAAYFVGDQMSFAADRLIWFVDMDLLSRCMSADQWERFSSAALQNGTARIARDALLQSHESLGTSIPDVVLNKLDFTGPHTRAETYLLHGSFPRRLWSNLWSLPKGASRIALLRDIFFPAERVMRQSFPQFAHRSLAWLHLYRYAFRLRKILVKRQQQKGKAG